MSTQGKVIQCSAAIAWEPKKPLTIETIDVEPPKAGEVRIKIIATGLCHSDVALLDGFDDKAKFPCILGHEAAGIIESIGPGVNTLKEGDHVITCVMPQCKECRICKSSKSNVCEKLDFEHLQGPGVMKDGTSRLSIKGQPIYNFVSLSTFTQYTVVDESYVTKISDAAPLDKVCLLSCGIITGYGAAVNTAKVEEGSVCAVWGLGTIGLAAIMGCRAKGASRIIGIDINPSKFEIAKQFGATEFVNPMDQAEPVQEVIKKLTNGGCDYTFECIGTVATMEAAFASCRRAGGECIVVGVAAGGHVLKVIPGVLLLGKILKGTLLGGTKPKDEIPELVEKYMNKKLMVDEFITGTMPLTEINVAIALLHEGKALRTVFNQF